MGSGMGVCFGRRTSHQLIWVSKEKGFSFQCQNTLRGSRLFVICYPTLFFRLTQYIPTRPLPQVLTLAGCFGNLCHSCDPVLKAHFWFEFCISIVKKISASPICCHVNIVERRALSLSLIKAVTSELYIFQYLLKNKNIICHCSINYKFISLFSYS